MSAVGSRSEAIRQFINPMAPPSGTKAERLRKLAIQAYWVADTAFEAKVARLLLDIYAPDVSFAPIPRRH